MPRQFDNLLTILFGAVVLAGLVLYLHPEVQPIDHAPSRAVTIVHQAQQMIEDSDIASAVQAFDYEGIFNRGGVYLFVLDATGENIYHAADHTLTGSDFSKLTDLDGRPFGQKLVRDTARDGVWHSYRARSGWRITYALKTKQGHIIAAGFSAPH